MPQFEEKLKKVLFHSFSRDVAILQAGTIFNTAIAFLTSLIFARLLGPEGYGFYGLVFALAGIINIFQEFGIGQGTINLLARAYAQKNGEEVKKILAAFTKISAAAALTVGILGTILAPSIGGIFYRDWDLGKLAAIVVAATALTYFFPLSAITLQVARKIKVLAILESLNKILMSGFPVIFLLGGFGVFGIVSGQFAAMILMSALGVLVYAGLASGGSLWPRFSEFWRLRLRIEYLKSFFWFGFAIALNKNFIKLAQTVPILLVGYFLATDSALGFYKIALGYMSLPVVLLGPVSRLLNVQFPRTEIAGREKLMRRFWQVTLLSALLSTVMVLPLLLAGPFLVRLFYGPEFDPSVKMIYPLAFYPIFMSLGVGLGPLFRTMNRMRAAVKIQAMSVLFLIPSAHYLIGHYHIRGLILTTLIFSLFPTLASFAYFSRVPKND